VSVIEHWQKDLPAVLHQPTNHHAFKSGVFHDFVGSGLSLGGSLWHGGWWWILKNCEGVNDVCRDFIAA
jgi:hypothetical protein